MSKPSNLKSSLVQGPEKFENYEEVTISVSLVGDEIIQELNRKYLDRDYPTDVLSFEINEPVDEGALHLGEVVVNRQQAKRQAPEYDNDWEHEVAELVAHGVLHLLGVHHKGDDHSSGEDNSKEEK